MTDVLATVLAAVRERTTPSREERRHLSRAADRLLARAESATADCPAETDLVRVGSTARGTWLPGDQDIDLFVRFPPDLPREDLESLGLAIGRAVLPDGRAEYAEHPYITGEFEGYDVDLVPCFRVESATDARSAVDRTPFHTEYVERAVTPALAADVRTLKAFLTARGIYGSDLRTEGFSGYLCELLVLEFGGVRPLIEAVADWHPPIELDPEGHGIRTFADPLVVVDPTDPERNVAAVLSETNLARFQHHARALLADPDAERFEPSDPEPISREALKSHLASRGTTPLALGFRAPDIVDDQLYPQLEKTRANLADELDRRGFGLVRSAAFAEDRALLLFEPAIDSLPTVERHVGPPVHVGDHAAAFYEKYEPTGAYGPFVERGRYVVERDREYTSAAACLEGGLSSVALGPDVERALGSGYDLLVGEDLLGLLPEFEVELARYYDPSP
ncbi:CCA tRNA nucleotidyltransferase [Halalkalicoccus jeotgali]|uniref:CCA-adding enzyme n=1 Tax=Halalkalicoccus jeotgali (strain DSM 18796 / CECT 7217 / JCM 14584 / KCTC 4019 / B3) TaxID=795797 RepID=D8J958_HALJB|nr:CCA tRNA nucleotidyltransferase [Halalkalicoccus jeotgali]ADJ16327.1 tRNA cytidylyltransferase [Halalkalicoccus jeotgali B3]ELY37062.1 tRNA CCA-pyrophosphorylase [Halalkalicoccus jeotgali B3]